MAQFQRSPATPLVNIGMPVYNGENYIREALDSLLAQNFADFELIISDNASTDETEAICRGYAANDARIRYIRQVVNKGAMANFQFVLHEAVGEYFMWAASDDYWDRDFIREGLLYLSEHHATAIVLPNYRVVSRRFPFATLNSPDMDFLESDDAHERVSKYTILPENTHKANLIYGIWRKSILSNLLEDITRIVDDRTPGFDICLITLALWRFKSALLNDVNFEKKYKNSPPGHWLGKVLHPLYLIHKRLAGSRVSVTSEKERLEYMSALRDTFRHMGLSERPLEALMIEKFGRL